MSSIPGRSVDESKDRNQTIATQKIAIVIGIVTEKKHMVFERLQKHEFEESNLYTRG